MFLVLCRNRQPGSVVLRGWMGSSWSHAALLDEGAQKVYDSTFFQKGVKASDAVEFFSRYSDFRLIYLRVRDIEAARAWLQEQIGKPYDWSALLGILFRTGDWSDEDAWFCSELAAAFINLFVREIFQEDAARITPYHLDILKDLVYDAN